MKRVALVAAHFPPSNLAAVHRTRLWAQHLNEFGWQPIIVTTHWRHYEEELDWDLVSLVDSSLEIIRTKALPTRPIRLVGDIGIRGFWWHYQALQKLAALSAIDFIHITVPSNFSAPLGRLVYERHHIPYGIDYIDPWIHQWPEAKVVLSKAWCSYQLGKILEPWAVQKASLITGVAPLYFQDVLDRNPEIRNRIITRSMPYGSSAKDFEQVGTKRQLPTLFDPNDGRFHLVYAGALLPKAQLVLDRLLEALGILKENRPDLMSRLRLHFIGTGRSATDKAGYQVLPRAINCGVGAAVSEHPHRMSYADVLTHLIHASGIVILGSTEPHYTPSKVFQAIQARRPIFALLHQASTAHKVIAESGAGLSIRLLDGEIPPADLIAEHLVEFVTTAWEPHKFTAEIENGPNSARHSAEVLASGLNEALALSR